MNVKTVMAQARQLSPTEQVELFDELVQLIDPQTAPFSLTPAQSADLKRRLDEVRSGKAGAIPGDEVVAKIRARL
jgi:putative addiction module component (TIGR02574 family)